MTDTAAKFSEYAHPEKLVSTQWVADHVDDEDVVVLESNEDALLYSTGHIPGAQRVDWHTELNDPVIQRERLTEQSLLAAEGDPEAMDLDEAFLRAMEFGMPPAGGMGLGVDRLVMLLTGAGIRETILFPLLRPVTGTIAILCALSVWNDFFTPLMYLSGGNSATAPLSVFKFVGLYGAQWHLVFSALIISVLPILAAYFIMQRFIIRGFASGLKG